MRRGRRRCARAPPAADQTAGPTPAARPEDPSRQFSRRRLSGLIETAMGRPGTSNGPYRGAPLAARRSCTNPRNPALLRSNVEATTAPFGEKACHRTAPRRSASPTGSPVSPFHRRVDPPPDSTAPIASVRESGEKTTDHARPAASRGGVTGAPAGRLHTRAKPVPVTCPEPVASRSPRGEKTAWLTNSPTSRNGSGRSITLKSQTRTNASLDAVTRNRSERVNCASTQLPPSESTGAARSPRLVHTWTSPPVPQTTICSPSAPNRVRCAMLFVGSGVARAPLSRV